jgi:hypothetical protein
MSPLFSPLRCFAFTYGGLGILSVYGTADTAAIDLLPDRHTVRELPSPSMANRALLANFREMTDAPLQ